MICDLNLVRCAVRFAPCTISYLSFDPCQVHTCQMALFWTECIRQNCLEIHRWSAIWFGPVTQTALNHTDLFNDTQVISDLIWVRHTDCSKLYRIVNDTQVINDLIWVRHTECSKPYPGSLWWRLVHWHRPFSMLYKLYSSPKGKQLFTMHRSSSLSKLLYRQRAYSLVYLHSMCNQFHAYITLFRGHMTNVPYMWKTISFAGTM